jgi:hypothetical protein
MAFLNFSKLVILFVKSQFMVTNFLENLEVTGTPSRVTMHTLVLTVARTIPTEQVLVNAALPLITHKATSP